MERFYWKFDRCLFKIRYEFRIESPSIIRDILRVRSDTTLHGKLILVDILGRELENAYRD